MRDIFDKDDAQLILPPPPDGDENLKTIGKHMSIPESMKLLKRIKKGRVSFRDFQQKSRPKIYFKSQTLYFEITNISQTDKTQN